MSHTLATAPLTQQFADTSRQLRAFLDTNHKSCAVISERLKKVVFLVLGEAESVRTRTPRCTTRAESTTIPDNFPSDWAIDKAALRAFCKVFERDMAQLAVPDLLSLSLQHTMTVIFKQLQETHINDT